MFLKKIIEEKQESMNELINKLTNQFLFECLNFISEEERVFILISHRKRRKRWQVEQKESRIVLKLRVVKSVL